MKILGNQSHGKALITQDLFHIIKLRKLFLIRSERLPRWIVTCFFFAWIHCTDVSIHCTDILIECK